MMTRTKLLVVGALLGGCTVMVNGKPRRIGGSTDEPPPQAAAPARAQGAAHAPAAPAARPQQPPAPPPPAAVVVAIDGATLTRDPRVIPATGTFDTTWSKVFGNASSPDCGNDVTSRPISSFELKQADSELHVAVTGGRNDGFVVRRGDLLWTECTYRTNETPTMAPVKGGWQAGRYDIYPIGRGNGRGQPQSFEIELYKPTVAVSWDKAQKLVISGKLDKPLMVEVATKPGRRATRAEHAGWHCDELALPAVPDLALTIERPIPGLTIRPLPSAVPVTLRKETLDAKGHRVCARDQHSKRGAPSYRAPSELEFERDAEGSYGISLGTPDAATDTQVTLMLFDDSTRFDPLAVRPFGGDHPALEDRWIGYQLPQLAVGALGATTDYASLELAAKVFALVPKQALVYAKLDYDKDLTQRDREGYPVRNEPMVVLGAEHERVTVMTADGLRFNVKASHVVLAPDGAPAIPARPRPLGKLDIGATLALLPPSAKQLAEAHDKRIAARAACRDRAWAPYGRQLPTYTRPMGVDVVVYKSARTRQIEDAGEAAMDRQCGTDAQSEKRTEAERIKLMVEVENGRAKLLAEATAGLR